MQENPIRYQDLITPDDSIEKLISQLEQLQTAYNGMSNDVKRQAVEVSNSLKTVSGATAEGRKAISEQSEEAKRLERAYKQLDAALASNAKEIARLNMVKREANQYNKLMVQRGEQEIKTMKQIKEASYNQLSAQYSLNKAYLNSLTVSERRIKKNKELLESTKAIYEEMKKYQAETGKNQLNVGNYPDLSQVEKLLGGLSGKLGITGKLTELVTSKTALMTAAVTAGTAAVVAATKAWADYNGELSQQMQVASVTTRLQGEELTNLVAAARSLAGVYDTDFREVINAANTLMAQFGVTGDEAIEIIKDGMQGMILGDGGKLLQMIQQYAPAFRDAGISAKQLVAIIHNSEGGIFTPENMNAIVMGIKNIRLMTNSTRDALAKIGIDGEKITKQLNEGTISIFDALRMVSDALNSVESGSQDAGEVMQQVFGRQGAMAGTNLAKAIKTLNTDLDETKLQTGTVGESLAKLNEQTERLEQNLIEIFGLPGWQEVINFLETELLFELNFVLETLQNIYKTIELIGDATGFPKFVNTVLEVIGPLGNVYGLLRSIKNLAGGKGSEDGLYNGEAEEVGTFTIYRPPVENAQVTTPTKPKGGGKKDNTLREQEQQEKQSLELRRKYQDTLLELIEDENTRERAKLIAHYDRQIEDLQIKLEKEKKLTEDDRKVINDQIVALEQVKQVKLADLWEKQLAKEQQANEKARKAAEQAKQASLKEQEKLIEIQFDIQNEEIDQLEISENKKTEMRLKAEKERLQKLLALYEKDGKILSAEEKKLIETQISGIDKQLGDNKKSRDMYDMLGLNLDDEKKEAISQSVTFAMDQLNQFMNAYVEAANKKRELADAAVDKAQSVLEKEIEARNNGYANEVETARKELELAKKNQQKAIEEQRKAQKAQQAIQAIEQMGNLVSASALIWSQLGFPWALAAIGVMWGSFAAAKIKAAQVTKMDTETYGEGTVELLQGGSHQSGNDIDLGRKPNGTRRRAEGGEFFAVINKRSSRKYRAIIPDVMNRLNDGTFAEKYMSAYDGGSLIVNEDRRTDISGLSADVRKIREQGESERYVDGNGNTVEQYKNLRRLIRR